MFEICVGRCYEDRIASCRLRSRRMINFIHRRVSWTQEVRLCFWAPSFRLTWLWSCVWNLHNKRNILAPHDQGSWSAPAVSSFLQTSKEKSQSSEMKRNKIFWGVLCCIFLGRRESHSPAQGSNLILSSPEKQRSRFWGRSAAGCHCDQQHLFQGQWL